MKKSRPDFRRHSVNSRYFKCRLPDAKILEIEFQNKVDAWVFESWSQGARSFRELLLNLPGVYPSEVLDALRRLRKNGKIPSLEVFSILVESASQPAVCKEPVAVENRFIEHPLDFEWRFTRQGVTRICEEIQKYELRNNAEILCLGCPSVYLFGQKRMKHLRLKLWDKNIPIGQMEEAMDISRLDINEGVLPPHNASVVVIDPPWYNPFYHLFLWAALNQLPLHGRILMSFPPEGTRATAKDDYNALLHWCSLNGLRLERRYLNCLPYRSPLFEVNALRQHGIINFPLNWRRGDLIVLSKQQTSHEIEKPTCDFPSEKWEEIRVRNSRIKICRARKSATILRGFGRTDVLASVSSRNKVRGLANVVTSGNRFLGTRVPDDVTSCLALIEPSTSYSMTKGFFASKSPLLMRKLTELICKEEREAAQYFRRIHEF